MTKWCGRQVIRGVQAKRGPNKEMEAEQARLKERAEQERKRMMSELADELDASVGCIVETVPRPQPKLQATARAMSGIATTPASRRLP